MSDYKDLFSGKGSSSGGGSFLDFEPGTYGSYWWRATKILFWIGIGFGVLRYGHQGIPAILAIVAMSAVMAPLKAILWGAIFWFFARLFR
jgi:hypothetical protein